MSIQTAGSPTSRVNRSKIATQADFFLDERRKYQQEVMRETGTNTDYIDGGYTYNGGFNQTQQYTRTSFMKTNTTAGTNQLQSADPKD